MNSNPGILGNPYATAKKTTCSCGSTYYYQWGTEADPMCYGCAKKKYLASKEDDGSLSENWNLHSSARCIYCQNNVPHSIPQHYIVVKAYDKTYPEKIKPMNEDDLLAVLEEIGSDTSQGQNEPKMDYIEVENGTVVSGIRPFTLDDFVSVKKRQLLSVTNKIITSQQVYKTGKSAGINWWDEQQNMSAEQVHKDIQKAKEQWKKGSLWHYNSSSSSY